MTLTEREGRGLRLTAAGVELQRAIEPLFDQIDETLRIVRLTGEGKAGTLRLGLTRTALDSWRVGRCLARLQECAPDLAVTVTEVTSEQQSEQLRTGALAIGIGFAGSPEDGLRSVPLVDIPIDSAVVAESHPLAGAASIRIRQLTGERLLLAGSYTSARHGDLLQAIRRAGVVDYDIQPTPASVYSLVAAGRGWAIAPGHHEIARPAGTVIVPLADFAVTLTLVAQFRRDEESPLAANVTEILQRAMNGDPDLPVSENPGRTLAASGLSLRQLHSFAVTAQAGSISLASRRLGMTQSGLSRRLRTFERDLGVVLFRRRLNGVELTPAGERLRADAARIRSLVDSALARIGTTAQGVTGRCTVGVLAAEFARDLIPAAIRVVAARHDNVSIEVDEMLSSAQVSALIEHRIDLGLAGTNGRLLEAEQLDEAFVLDDPIECALIGESNPLAKRKSLQPADLAGLPLHFIDRESNPSFYDMVLQELAAIGASPRLVWSYHGPRAMWRATADLGGWALGTRSLRGRPYAGIVAVPVARLQIPWGIRLLCRRDESDPAVLAVRDVLRDLVASGSPPPNARRRKAVKPRRAP